MKKRDEVCSVLVPGEDSQGLWGPLSQQVLQVLSPREPMGISLLHPPGRGEDAHIRTGALGSASAVISGFRLIEIIHELVLN